jgi:proteic killer suppression protein
MIRTFKHKGLKTLFETGRARAVAADLHRRLIRQLDLLNRAKSSQDMNLPGYRFHELKGERRGTYSVTASGNWRLTFTFTGTDAFDVDLEDYH